MIWLRSKFWPAACEKSPQLATGATIAYTGAMVSDLNLLVAAGLFVCLPWSGAALTGLTVTLLGLQAILLVLVLSGSRPVKLCEWGLDACLVVAVVMARISWSETDLSGNWLLIVPALLLQLFFLRFMLFHSKAHGQMELESQQRLEMRLGNVEQDLSEGLIDSARAQESREHLEWEHQDVLEIFRLGKQTAGLALIQTGCLLFSRPSGSWWLAWCLIISLATFLNSKAQDLMLKHYLPEDNRLC